jgi:hypothetical protein
MLRKIHMQDQVFNNVAQIMNHYQTMPIHISIAGIRITMQFPVPVNKKHNKSKFPQLKSLAVYSHIQME